MKPWKLRRRSQLTEGLGKEVLYSLDLSSGRWISGTTDAKHASLEAHMASFSLQGMVEGEPATIDPASVECVGSYSWVKAAKSTILVPAYPPIVDLDTPPFQIISDVHMKLQTSEQPIHDERLLSKSPLLSLLLAADAFTSKVSDSGSSSSDTFDWTQVDFVTDRRALRQLLRCVGQQAKTDDFRLNVHLVGERTILLRTHNPEFDDRRVSPGSYGESFEHSQTRAHPESDGTFGHHRRIVTYTFGGLRMVVRFEADACYLDEDESLPSSSAVRRVPTSSPAMHGISIKRNPSLAPQSSLVELKTTSKTIRFADVYTQLYFSQTPHLLIGKHTNGQFHTIEKHHLHDPSGYLATVGARVQPGLNKLAKLLRGLQSLAVVMSQQGNRSRHSALMYADGRLDMRCAAVDEEKEVPEALIQELFSKVPV